MTADEAATLLLGWVPSSVGEMANLNPSNPDRVPPDETEVSFVPMASVEALSGVMHPSARRTWRTVRKGYKRFQDGDVLVAKITPSMENGKAALASQLIGGVGAGSTEFHVIRPTEALVGKFLLHFLLQESVRREARAHMTGTAGQLRVPESFYESLGLHLPPINEQHRIVQALDSYLTRLDAAQVALERVQASLKRYRASVLKAAVEGNLVTAEAELARKEGRDYEPADRLLERILAEGHAHWEFQERRRGKYKESFVPDTSDLPELPDGWVWATLGQVSYRIQYGTSSKAGPDATGIPVLRMSNIQNGDLDLSDLKYLSAQDVDVQKTMLEHGDLLFNRTNSAELVGKCAVFKGAPSRACFASYLIRVSFECFLPEFACAYLNSEHGRRYISHVRSQQVGQANVNGTKLAAMPIPVPSLGEQRRIVIEVERRLSVIQQAEATVEASLKRAERLRQSILKQAFCGKLVPQDPSDEPATVLLERIRLEREASHADAKTSRQPRRRRAKPISARQLMLREGNP